MSGVMDTTPKINPERTKRQSLAFGRNLIVLALLILARHGIGRMAT